MNYQYAEPFLEINFGSQSDGKSVRIKKSLITDIYEYCEEGKIRVKIHFVRGNESTWYRFFGTMEEFEKNSKTVFI